MNWSFIIKINLMLVAFIVVVLVMRSMKTDTGPSGIAAVLGTPAPEPSQPTPGATTTLDWCDTRVVEIGRQGKPSLRQEKLKWYSNTDTLEFIPVEKWFGRNCRVKIDRVSPQEFDAATAAPAMVVKFIKGEPETLLVSKGVYQWRRELFRSAEMDQALVDLDTLPKQQGIDKK